MPKPKLDWERSFLESKIHEVFRLIPEMGRDEAIEMVDLSVPSYMTTQFRMMTRAAFYAGRRPVKRPDTHVGKSMVRIHQTSFADHNELREIPMSARWRVMGTTEMLQAICESTRIDRDARPSAGKRTATKEEPMPSYMPPPIAAGDIIEVPGGDCYLVQHNCRTFRRLSASDMMAYIGTATHLRKDHPLMRA